MDLSPGLWLIILTVGVVALLMALIYARSRTKKLTPTEIALTEAATRAEYRNEDQP